MLFLLFWNVSLTLIKLSLAERQGFEPWEQLPVHRISSAARSTTPASFLLLNRCKCTIVFLLRQIKADILCEAAKKTKSEVSCIDSLLYLCRAISEAAGKLTRVWSDKRVFGRSTVHLRPAKFYQVSEEILSADGGKSIN